MTVVALCAPGRWLPDARGEDRALRVSWHAELDCVVLSTWRGDTCASTVRLDRAGAAALVAALAEGLAELGAPAAPGLRAG